MEGDTEKRSAWERIIRQRQESDGSDSTGGRATWRRLGGREGPDGGRRDSTGISKPWGLGNGLEATEQSDGNSRDRRWAEAKRKRRLLLITRGRKWATSYTFAAFLAALSATRLVPCLRWRTRIFLFAYSAGTAAALALCISTRQKHHTHAIWR